MNEITENGDKEEELPEEAVPVENQVAGHRFGYCLNKVALLRHSKTTDILKPICDKRSEREFRFYSTVWNSDNNNDLIIAQLRSFLAQYNGIFTNVKNGKNFIRLKDLTIDFNEPSILDVKIGPKTYDPEANQTKIISEINKYQFAQQIGFRILGMRIYSSIRKEYIIKDKDYGQKLTPDDINEGEFKYKSIKYKSIKYKSNKFNKLL
jgi:1D-myo-inositol-tetrakisphosphate 5-kinase/inositol-polyphosphate multikinase